MSEPFRVELVPAFILHQRDFRNTSKIFDLYTATEGRVSVVAKGIRSARSATKGTIQAFQPLRISWAGKNELKTLTDVESVERWPLLTGTQLLCGFYVNEISMRLAPTSQADPELFLAYHEAISALCFAESGLHAIMRRFELKLLSSIGHGLNLLVDTTSGEEISPNELYIYHTQSGPQLYTQALDATNVGIKIAGEQLLAISNYDFQDHDVLVVAAKIMRTELGLYLGQTPLKSRQVLMSMLKREKNG